MDSGINRRSVTAAIAGVMLGAAGVATPQNPAQSAEVGQASQRETKSPAPMADAVLYAIGVVTPHGQQTVEQYERILGVRPSMPAAVPSSSAAGSSSGPPPAVDKQPARRPPAGGGVVEPNGEKVVFNMQVVFFPNLYVKVFQPTSSNGPYAEHLQKYGMGVQDAQLLVSDIKSVRADLLQKGGRWTLGSQDDFWAYMDFRGSLGITLEPITTRPHAPVNVAPNVVNPLGTMPVTHVGFAVSDVTKAAKAYSDVFGIPMPAVTEVRDLKFPPGTTWNKSAHLRVARWKQGDIGIELIESVGGPTPWSEFVKKQKGNAAFNVGFDVGDRMDETLRDLQAKGGKWIYGEPGGNDAYLDFTDDLGLAIEITGKSRGGK